MRPHNCELFRAGGPTTHTFQLYCRSLVWFHIQSAMESTGSSLTTDAVDKIHSLLQITFSDIPLLATQALPSGSTVSLRNRGGWPPICLSWWL